MQLSLSGTQTMACSPYMAWQFLLDVNNVASCVTGFQHLNIVGNEHWEAQVVFLNTTYLVDIVRTKLKTPCMVVEMRTSALGIKATIDNEITLAEIDAGHTRVDWNVTVTLDGNIPGPMKLALPMSARVFTNQFFRCLQSKLEAGFLTSQPVQAAPAQSQPVQARTMPLQHRQNWQWPWYIAVLVAAALTSFWPFWSPQPSSLIIGGGLIAFSLLTFGVMLLERMPEALLIPATLAALAIGKTLSWSLPLEMGAYSCLCVAIFASQFLWRSLLSIEREKIAARMHQTLAIGGQVAVVFSLIVLRNQADNHVMLDHVGAGGLLVLALLILWSRKVRQAQIPDVILGWSYYIALLFVFLVISWELVAFNYVKWGILTLPPASYLALVAPQLIKDKTLVGARQIGMVVLITGAALLLGPPLFLSFSENVNDNVISTLVLMGESVGLLFLGIWRNIRTYRYTGLILAVIGALRTALSQGDVLLKVIVMAFLVIMLMLSALLLARQRGKQGSGTAII